MLGRLPSALVLPAALALVAACDGPRIPEGVYACEPGVPGDCPPGWFCRDGRCYSSPGDGGTDADADVPDDAPDDGPGDEGDGEVGCDPATCNDGNPCNGEEVCSIDGRCLPTLPPDEGSPCSTPCGEGQCFLGECRPLTCGDGTVDECEDCDDGNSIVDDGCEPDCTFTCVLDAECDDDDPCSGEARCLAHRCAPGTPSADGTPCGAGLRCLAGACLAPDCPDGLLDDGEECDDGNFVDGDGCEIDCTPSCREDADCSDLRLCNGVERCDPIGHLCREGTPAADGTPCTTAEGLDGECRAGSCAVVTCGDSTVDPGEECDDGNTVAGDGCENDCTWSCEADPDCDDLLVCNGAEGCDLPPHVCVPGTPVADGTSCDLDGNLDTRDICLAGTCRLSDCSDGFADVLAGEECDDGNTTAGDGCENDCTWSCEADLDCDDLDACSGVESCDTARHRCTAGTPLADDTPCTTAGGTTGRCRGGVCTRTSCGDGTVQIGEECDDGNTVADDGCEATCLYSCHGAADCREAPDDPCTVDTCEPGGTGQLCRRTFGADPCDDHDACTAGDRCDGTGACRGTAIDADDDGYGPGVACGGDCDDGAGAIHPGATEVCNAVDDDCSGVTDDGPGMTCAQGSSRACVVEGPGGSCAGVEACLGDVCRWSGLCELAAVESCNGSDDDCDGTTDEGFECVQGSSVPCTTSCGVPAARLCDAVCVLGPCAAAEVACNGCDDDADGLTDEGTWCPVAGLPTTQDLFAVRGSGAGDVWVVGNAGTILHWDGTAWSSVSGGGSRVLRSVFAASPAAAWAVGDAGAILAWNGTTWSAESAPAGTGNLRGVWGFSAAEVWAVGDGGRILRRTAGGWASVGGGTTLDLGGVWGAAANDVFACAGHKTYTRWNGTAWSSGTLGDGNFDAYAIAGSSADSIWTVGSVGASRHWAGSGWSTVVTGVTTPLRGAHAPSRSEAWAVGDGGTIRRWDGTAWSASTSGTTRTLYGVWGPSASEVWVVGASGTILRGSW
ncbi:MAG: DUF4215 domain-containing protein [Deltaproteobacteria bacterium]|nr:DUF4215 domain-containing protein [Deltaproteobacteria bacterium]